MMQQQDDSGLSIPLLEEEKDPKSAVEVNEGLKPEEDLEGDDLGEDEADQARGDKSSAGAEEKDITD